MLLMCVQIYSSEIFFLVINTNVIIAHCAKQHECDTMNDLSIRETKVWYYIWWNSDVVKKGCPTNLYIINIINRNRKNSSSK